MVFASLLPFGLPTQNRSSNNGEFLEFLKVLDLERNLSPNKMVSLFL